MMMEQIYLRSKGQIVKGEFFFSNIKIFGGITLDKYYGYYRHAYE